VAVWYQSFSVDWVGTWQPSKIGHYVGVPDFKGREGPRLLGAGCLCLRGLAAFSVQASLAIMCLFKEKVMGRERGRGWRSGGPATLF